MGCLANLKDQVAVASSSESNAKESQSGCWSRGYGLRTGFESNGGFFSGSRYHGSLFRKTSEGRKTASAGYYNSAAFSICQRSGSLGRGRQWGCFLNECKEEVIQKAKETGGPFDLVIYSLASPRRTDPVNGETYRACLKPIGAVYKNKTLDTDRKEVKEVTIDPANEQEVADTQKVMGGEDWEAWTDLLLAEGLMAPGCLNLAYSYIGPEVTWPIYRNGTIGKAKEHLENSAAAITEKMKLAGCGDASFP